MNEEGSLKKITRSILEPLGIVIPDEIRKQFEGKTFRVVDDDEFDKMFLGEEESKKDSNTKDS